MRRSLTAAVAGLVVATCAVPPAAFAHQGDSRYDSVLTGAAIPGVSVQVLNYGDRLLVHNQTQQTVLVEGYEGEDYARLEPSGVVQVNMRSPAAYINDDPYGTAPVPTSADAGAPPVWKTVSGDGRFEFHDHRIHWMSKNVLPQQVKDKSVRTKVFDWTVPMHVGATSEPIRGTLFWRGSTGGAPIGAYVGFGAFLLLCAGLVVVVRRRRGGEAGATGAAGAADAAAPHAEPTGASEAW
jgi:hypothetical protein